MIARDIRVELKKWILGVKIKKRERNGWWLRE